jgi:uncharacterized damage-inducible protein DinB
MSDPRYPIGPWDRRRDFTSEERAQHIDIIAGTPAALRKAVEGLSEEQLDTPYREGGWTLRQVAHHVPDSHANAYIRVKLALTEDNPTIKPYDEAAWARLEDTRVAPVASSLAIVDALHVRWETLLRSMSEAEFARTFFHPERGTALRLDTTLGLYAWHGRHHVAHVTRLRDREGWE